MSKIAEKIHDVALQKAEEYSKTHGHSIIEEVAYGRGYKTAYIECYDQAMQDFLEKAERWLEPTFKNLAGYNSGGDLMNDFINYMQNEM